MSIIVKTNRGTNRDYCVETKNMKQPKDYNVSNSSGGVFYSILSPILWMKIVCVVALTAMLICTFPLQSFAMEEEDIPLTTDNRIKTYIYSPNEIYLMVLHHGFQSHIEFSTGEEIQTISLGDSYAWEITPLAHRLFIKPMAKNIRTNMTIITNKRTYQFDIVSEDEEKGAVKDLVYVIRFYYPPKVR